MTELIETPDEQRELDEVYCQSVILTETIAQCLEENNITNTRVIATALPMVLSKALSNLSNSEKVEFLVGFAELCNKACFRIDNAS